MITFRNTITIVLLKIIMLISFSVSAQYKDIRKIEKTYEANAATTIEIKSKYGNINILPWEKDSVKIIVEISINTKIQKKLEALKSIINIEFINTDYYILAKTKFTRNKSLFSDIFSDNTISSDDQVKIDYIIMAPAYINFKINHKYGDVIIENTKGNFSIVLSNGLFKAGNLLGITDMELDFCNSCTINQLNIGIIKAQYTNFEIKKAERIKINSKSSKIILTSSKALNIKSKRDNYFIENLNQISGDTYFSNIHINQLFEEAGLDLKYGEITIENLEKYFSLINITSKQADVNIKTLEGTDYMFEIIQKDAEIIIPKNAVKTRETNINDDFIKTIGFMNTSGNNNLVNNNSKPNISASNEKQSNIKIKTEGGSYNLIKKN